MFHPYNAPITLDAWASVFAMVRSVRYTAQMRKRRWYRDGGALPAKYWRETVKTQVHKMMEALHFAISETIATDPHIVG